MKWPRSSTTPAAVEVEEVDVGSSSSGPSQPEGEPSLGKKFCQFCSLEIPKKAIRCYHCHMDQVLKAVVQDEGDEARVVKFNGFKLILCDIIDDEDPEAGPVFTDVEFKIKDKNLQTALSRQGISLSHRGFTDEEKKAGYIKGEELVVFLPKLRAYWANEKSSMVRSFLAQVEDMQATMTKQIKKLLERKKTVFPALWFIFEEGTQIYSWKSGCKVGAAVVSSSYSYGFDMMGEMVKSDGEQFYYMEEKFTIRYFGTVKRLEDLEVQVMDDESMDELIARGQQFNKLGVGHHFKAYEGFMMKSFSSFFTHKVPADGRVMIDTSTYNRLHPSDSSFRFSGAGSRRQNMRNRNQNQHQYQYDMWGNAQESPQSNPNQFKQVSEEDLFMCWPTLPGFSFKKKQWGEFLISLCQDIVFDDKAFDQLVLAPKKKDLIKSLVECQDNRDVVQKGFKDIISGKGGGCIFLLHGPPGTGKTLTAEAVSEHLHTPLYSVSVGELGTTSQSLETNLQRILEVAAVWRASILMDEADIFLERRSKSDIMRNAMVGIFLRLLEYHNGVLFLTTNRIKAIDEAFNSRISIALHYEDLDKSARKAVWRNFIQHLQTSEGQDAVAPNLDLDELAEYALNGRQIRSTVKLSQSLAVYEKTPLSMEHLRSTISVALSFEEKFDEQVKAKRKEKNFYKNRLDQKEKDDQKAKGKGKEKKGRKITVTLEGEESDE
jgi:hypothetical protein